MTNPTCPHCGVGIGEHEANACLDKWVAETVMGWKWMPTPDPEGQHYCWVKDGCEIGDFEPSSDISAAWEVLERLRDMDCDVALCSAGATWLVESNVLGVTVRSESALLAICRAAVLAATGENP